MVDVGQKTPTAREAVACGRVCLGPEAFRAVVAGTAGKGDVLGVARIAGIQAAKRTADWIPLAHSLPLESIEIAFDPIAQTSAIEIRATARTTAKTGVEMEALVAVSAAALTIYDMCKAIHKGIVIEEITLLRKSGGKSGLYEAPQRPTAGKAEASTEA
jgi:cyclic pyranopterin phosphate synthase